MWPSSTSTGSPTRVCWRSSTLRPAGRGGPGAGRPAKLYRRAAGEVTVSLPPRDYQLAGRLLARAVTDAERERVPVGLALSRAARTAGQALGEHARLAAGERPTPTDLLAAALVVLVANGYEPRIEGPGVVLANCPFDALAEQYTELVCGMNLDLLSGLLDGLRHPDVEARLEPAPGLCCVYIRSGSTKEAR